MDENTPKPSRISEFFKNKKNVRNILVVLISLGIVAGGYYWYVKTHVIYIEKAEISAPLITLGAEQPGILREILVKNGDYINNNQPVARLENGFVRSKTAGMVVDVNNEIGKLFTPGSPIVTMIDPAQLHVVAHIAENKGLGSIHIGQKVTFTVDTFGSKKYFGKVEEIAKTSDQSSIVFSISDKRAEKEFSVKIQYDVKSAPELVNDMSAKVWIAK